MSLQYYAIENAAYPELHAARCTTVEARLAVKRLSVKFRVQEPDVTFTSGRRTSQANAYRLTLNVDHLTWLLVCHEFAHTIHDARGRAGERWHGPTHRRLVKRLSAYVTEQGWLGGVLMKQFQQVQEAKELRDSERLARRQSHDFRIKKRRVQISRLEIKIKALQTRLKTARRSLAALERAKQRAEATASPGPTPQQ